MAWRPGYRAPVREPPRIVTNVIEARFDDLTGAEPSFRLVGPAGVLEARRPEEVADAVMFFAGDTAKYVTGQVRSVSGGLTMAG